MSRVVDSSVIITLFDEDDPRRDDAFDLVASPAPTLVPPEVITEVLGVVHARMGYEVSQVIWEDLADLGNIVFLNSTAQERVGPIFTEGRGALSWTDAAVVAHCLREDAKPLCYDPDIEAAYEAGKH